MTDSQTPKTKKFDLEERTAKLGENDCGCRSRKKRLVTKAVAGGKRAEFDF